MSSADDDLAALLRAVQQLATALQREHFENAAIRRAAHEVDRSAGRLALRLLDKKLRQHGR